MKKIRNYYRYHPNIKSLVLKGINELRFIGDCNKSNTEVIMLGDAIIKPLNIPYTICSLPASPLELKYIVSNEAAKMAEAIIAISKYPHRVKEDNILCINNIGKLDKIVSQLLVEIYRKYISMHLESMEIVVIFDIIDDTAKRLIRMCINKNKYTIFIPIIKKKRQSFVEVVTNIENIRININIPNMSTDNHVLEITNNSFVFKNKNNVTLYCSSELDKFVDSSAYGKYVYEPNGKNIKLSFDDMFIGLCDTPTLIIEDNNEHFILSFSKWSKVDKEFIEKLLWLFNVVDANMKFVNYRQSMDEITIKILASS